MAIEPEIIPSSSTLGEEANSISPKWINIFKFVTLSLVLVYLLKTLFSVFLTGLGLWFIWQQATKKIQ